MSARPSVAASTPRLNQASAYAESIATAAEMADASPLADFYCDRMPRLLVEQILRGEDRARRLLWMELDPGRTPRFVAALRGLADALASQGLRAAPPVDPGRTPTSAARMASRTRLGSGLPLVSAYPAEPEAMRTVFVHMQLKRNPHFAQGRGEHQTVLDRNSRIRHCVDEKGRRCFLSHLLVI